MSEEAEIKRMGAVAQKNSGRGKVKKGDAILYPFCVDIKEFTSSFSLSKAVWAKISTDAITSGLYQPALNVVLGENDGNKVRLFVVGEKMFHEMLEAWRNSNDS